MKSKILAIVSIIFLFLYLQPEWVEAFVDRITDDIAKDEFERAKVVCAGKAKTITQAEQAKVTVCNASMPGYWNVAEFNIDHLIKGEVESQTIRVKFFLESSLIGGCYFEPIPVAERCLLFLIPVEGVESTYTLVCREGAIISLPPLPSQGFPATPKPSERLAAEMLEAIKSKDARIAVEAMKCLKRLYLTGPMVITALKDLSKTKDPEIAGTAIAVRIEMRDGTALADAKALIESGRCSAIQCGHIARAVERNATQDQIGELKKLVNLNDVYMRRAVIYVFRVMKNKSLLPYLVTALDDEDNEVRFNALMGLSEMLGPMRAAGEVVTFTRTGRQEECIKLWKDWWDREGKTRYLGK